MDPVRQKVLRTMEIIGEPVTAKKLADQLNMAPAACKYHMTQLESIGLLSFDHSRQIHGITAKYYKPADVTVSLGMDSSEYQNEKEAIAETSAMSVMQNFIQAARSHPDDLPFQADSHQGVVRLSDKDYEQLHQKILEFIEDHQANTEDSHTYEFSVVYYRTEL